MVTFLFWNLMKNEGLAPRLIRIAQQFGIDVVLLAECAVDLTAVAQTLSASGAGPYTALSVDGGKIHILSRLSASDFISKYTDPEIGLHIRSLQTRKVGRVLVASLHYPSKLQWSDKEQEHGAMFRLIPAIQQMERASRHKRTVLVGDFNMNPFEGGVMSAFALHAVMTRALALREERTVAGEPYQFFYNPMWGHFGDRTPGPPGTFYLSSSKPGNCFWNMYDQVLLRPTLMGRLHRLEILTSDGVESLLTRTGLPSRDHASDHLPLLFTLDL